MEWAPRCMGEEGFFRTASWPACWQPSLAGCRGMRRMLDVHLILMALPGLHPAALGPSSMPYHNLPLRPSPSRCSILPYAGLKFFTYQHLKQWYHHTRPREVRAAPTAQPKQPDCAACWAAQVAQGIAALVAQPAARLPPSSTPVPSAAHPPWYPPAAHAHGRGRQAAPAGAGHAHLWRCGRAGGTNGHVPAGCCAPSDAGGQERQWKGGGGREAAPLPWSSTPQLASPL